MTKPRTWLEADAGKTAVIPIAGLLIGIMAGVVRIKLSGATDLEALWIIAKNSLVGSFLGMGAALIVAGGMENSLTTVRGLTWLTVVSAVLLIVWLSVP